jgi:hypothetical protein
MVRYFVIIVCLMKYELLSLPENTFPVESILTCIELLISKFLFLLFRTLRLCIMLFGGEYLVPQVDFSRVFFMVHMVVVFFKDNIIPVYFPEQTVCRPIKVTVQLVR